MIFESGRPGSNPEWGPIYYKASITAEGLLERSSPRGSTSVPEQPNIKAVTGACKLIDGCNLELCSAMPSVASCHHLANATEIKSIQLFDSIVMASP